MVYVNCFNDLINIFILIIFYFIIIKNTIYLNKYFIYYYMFLLYTIYNKKLFIDIRIFLLYIIFKSIIFQKYYYIVDCKRELLNILYMLNLIRKDVNS
jgi:hypothetical protein